MHVCKCVCVCVHVWVYMCVCVCVCVHVCVYRAVTILCLAVYIDILHLMYCNILTYCDTGHYCHYNFRFTYCKQTSDAVLDVY